MQHNLRTTLPLLLYFFVTVTPFQKATWPAIFSIPGFGQLGVSAIFGRDYNVVVGIQLVVAVLTMVGLLLPDLLYAVVDPRISLS